MADLGAERDGHTHAAGRAYPSVLQSPAAVLGVVALVAALVRLAVLSLGLETLDRQAYPDDTYDVLTIARHIAQGVGPSVDGVTLATGFQPLIGLLLTPVFG